VDSKAEYDQFNLAHENKTNKRQCPNKRYDNTLYKLKYRYRSLQGFGNSENNID